MAQRWPHRPAATHLYPQRPADVTPDPPRRMGSASSCPTNHSRNRQSAIRILRCVFIDLPVDHYQRAYRRFFARWAAISASHWE